MMPAIDPAIAHLDWPICHCQSSACQGQCTREATTRTTCHALDHCNRTDDARIDVDGNRTFELCPHCYDTLRKVITSYVTRLSRYGRPHCLGCGAPIRRLEDVIRETSQL